MTAIRPLTWQAAALAWFAILLLAILNGALREALLVPAWGRTPATMTSGVLLVAAVLGVAWLLLRRRVPSGAAHCWLVGAAWLVATLVFEFTTGFATGKSWTEMLAAYRFAEGNLWPIVLVVVLLAPMLVHRFRRRD